MTTDNRPTIAERQAAKRAERRARIGLPNDSAPTSKRARKGRRYTAEQRMADRIDGYDRDDLGESPDW